MTIIIQGGRGLGTEVATLPESRTLDTLKRALVDKSFCFGELLTNFSFLSESLLSETFWRAFRDYCQEAELIIILSYNHEKIIIE